MTLALSVGRGRAATYDLEVRDASGNLVDLVTAGRELRFSAKLALTDADPPLIYKENGAGITPAADQPGVGKGLAQLRLIPADTTVAGIPDDGRAYFLECQLELVVVTGEPEVVDSGILGVYPVVRDSTA